MDPGKLPVPGRPAFWIIVGQGPTALAVGVDGGCLSGGGCCFASGGCSDNFTLLYHFFPLSFLSGRRPDID